MGTHKNNAGRAVIYCRTNQLSPFEAQLGLAAQEGLCREAAVQHSIHVIAMFSDKGSGVAPYLPGVLDMLDFVKHSGAPAPVVIIDDLARLSRSPSQLFEIRRQLEKAGSGIALARARYDRPSTDALEGTAS